MVQVGIACVDGDGVSIHQHGQPAVQRDVDSAAQPRFTPDEAWKEFVDPDKWQQVQESMDIMAYARKLGRKAMQQLKVRENDPDHVKVAALHKCILQEAAAETEDVNVAKMLLTIAGSLPSAYSKAAAKFAEERAAPSVDRVALLHSKAQSCQEALRARLQELQEEEARYHMIRQTADELKELNRQVEESLDTNSKQRVALAAKYAAANRIDARTDEKKVRRFTIPVLPSACQPSYTVHDLYLLLQIFMEKTLMKIDTTVQRSQAARQALEVCHGTSL